jgi:broad specificity phosphatase PhoE
VRDGIEGASGPGTDGPLAVTRVYLVRHGQTALNAAGVLRGHLDPSLDKRGLDQARQLGSALGDRDITLVVSSPLCRALETSRSIAVRAGLVVATDDRWVDRDYGRWAGRRRDLAEAEWGSIDDAPGVEPAHEVRARARSALHDVAVRAAGGSAIVVSHDVVIRFLLVDLDPGLGDPDRLPQETGCFNRLEVRNERWRVVSLNELPDEETRASSNVARRPRQTAASQEGDPDARGR